MSYTTELYPFRFHRLGADSFVAVSESGDYSFLTKYEIESLISNPATLSLDRVAELKSKYFIGHKGKKSTLRLLLSRIATKKETVLDGPSLHIVVPTLQCAHSCRYCQVSRSTEGKGYTISQNDLRSTCELIFQSRSRTLTVEFQGGDPLLRFDLVQDAIELIIQRNIQEKREIRFVVASTLHQLSEEMCLYFRDRGVFLSTSIDGPPTLHNKNRPLGTKDSYERTRNGIELARRIIGPEAVSALMTTTRDSLGHPEAIVDNYVENGFGEIFLRPLSYHGFARRNARYIGYTMKEFSSFYERAFERILYWNRRNIPIREVTAAIALNKMLSTFDCGFVDLQSPTGSALAVLVYNYDGYVYPSDEARMLAETGDTALRLGHVTESLQSIMKSPVVHDLVRGSLSRYIPGCSDCAFNAYCGPDPVGMYAEYGNMESPVLWSKHCQQYKWLFDFLFGRLKEGDASFVDLAYVWANTSNRG